MPEKDVVIQYKLQRARNYLAEVESHISKGFYATAINRLYYACFFATNALLLTKDISAKTHNGVASMLATHFVKTGEFEKEKAIFFSHLLDERFNDDYGDFITIDEGVVEEYFTGANEYLLYIEKLLAQRL